MAMRMIGTVVMALGLAGCVSNVENVSYGMFNYSGRTVDIRKETFLAKGFDGATSPQTRYYVESNFDRFPCDGTAADCRKVYEHAETNPRERGDDREVPIWILRR